MMPRYSFCSYDCMKKIRDDSSVVPQNGLCVYCNEDKVKIKKRRCCSRCFSRLREIGFWVDIPLCENGCNRNVKYRRYGEKQGVCNKCGVRYRNEGRLSLRKCVKCGVGNVATNNVCNNCNVTGYVKHKPELLEKQNWICGDRDKSTKGCFKKIESEDDAEVDHVIPRSLDGSDDIGNLQVMHEHCNRSWSSRLCDGRLAKEYLAKVKRGI